MILVLPLSSPPIMKKNIIILIDKIINDLSNKLDYEIIVVDDNSE